MTGVWSKRHFAAPLLMALLIAGCVSGKRPPSPVTAPPPPPVLARPAPPPAPPTNAAGVGVEAGPPVSSLTFTPDGAAVALTAFRSSCRALLRRVDASGLTRQADWKPACDAAALPDTDPIGFFTTAFETIVVGPGKAFATGYYEPEIEGSRTRQPGYDVPIYRKPPDLVEVTASPGPPIVRSQRGRMQDGVLVPYYERAEIDGGVLSGKGLEIAWAKDAYEVFFLQIQGSGRLRLPDGTVMRLGYDSQNGREYVGIGSVMRQRGLIGAGSPFDTSMQGMLAWMRGHPADAPAVLELNKSFVFFRELTGAGPIGALNVPVAAHVSIAADQMFIPLGAPVFLTMDRREASGLWIAQDTGGAIKGANRVDTFWGAGIEARVIAGGMSARGTALIFVPRGTLDRLKGAGSGGAAARR